MRKLLFVAALSSLIIVSCQKNQFDTDTTVSEVSQDALAQLAAYGFNTHDVKKIDGGYLVEGDIMITDKELKDGIDDTHELIVGDSEHYRTTNLVTGLPRLITVRVHSSLPSSYLSTTDAAIARYNALGLRITFQRVTSGGNIVITQTSSSGFLASAGFPSGGNPYPSVLVGTILNSWNTNTVITVLAHEIGHCVGFRHSDYMNRSFSCGGAAVNEGSAGVGAIHIPGSPTGPASGSWMLACIGNGVNRPFNAADQAALHYIY